MPTIQADLDNFAIWAGVVLTLAFAARYTMLHSWWRHAVGRALIALDACLLLVLIPAAIRLAIPSLNRTTTAWQVIDTVALCGAVVVIGYRLFSLEKARFRRASPTRTDQQTGQGDGGHAEVL